MLPRQRSRFEMRPEHDGRLLDLDVDLRQPFEHAGAAHDTVNLAERFGVGIEAGEETARMGEDADLVCGHQPAGGVRVVQNGAHRHAILFRRRIDGDVDSKQCGVLHAG